MQSKRERHRHLLCKSGQCAEEVIMLCLNGL